MRNPVSEATHERRTESNKVVILGGGPGGYEAALVAAQLGAEVTVIDSDGLGGSAVLTDCVPSKTLIATAELMSEVAGAAELGVNFRDSEGDSATSLAVDLGRVNARVKRLAADQSSDIARRLDKEGVQVVTGRGVLDGPGRVVVGDTTYDADAILIATGAAPRTLPTAQPDGERILTWEQVYDLDEVPSELIVVGSGVTGAEFASAYLALGIPVTLVSSRDRVLPGEDADASLVLEEVSTRRGMTVLSKSRMESVTRDGDVVTVTLTDGRSVQGSHCILALGSVPNTGGIGLEESGVILKDGGFVNVDRVSRTSARGVYSAGDCTGVLMLASVAAMQGRIAMWHFLGDTVHPLDLKKVSSNVFTAPEIATVGWSQQAVDAGEIQAESVTLPLSGNPRAKMQGVRDGFVKLFCRPGTGIVVGGVIVGPRASELIHPVSIAVAESLTADQLAQAFTVYPSMSGSVAEAARQAAPLLITRASSEQVLHPPDLGALGRHDVGGHLGGPDVLAAGELVVGHQDRALVVLDHPGQEQAVERDAVSRGEGGHLVGGQHARHAVGRAGHGAHGVDVLDRRLREAVVDQPGRHDEDLAALAAVDGARDREDPGVGRPGLGEVGHGEGLAVVRDHHREVGGVGEVPVGVVRGSGEVVHPVHPARAVPPGGVGGVGRLLPVGRVRRRLLPGTARQGREQQETDQPHQGPGRAAMTSPLHTTTLGSREKQ